MCRLAGWGRRLADKILSINIKGAINALALLPLVNNAFVVLQIKAASRRVLCANAFD
jgi:hypothetical protein